MPYYWERPRHHAPAEGGLRRERCEKEAHAEAPSSEGTYSDAESAGRIEAKQLIELFFAATSSPQVRP